jgi:chaperonin GroES
MNTSGITPLGFAVVVRLDPVEEKTKGGIIIPDSIKDADELSAQEGTLVAAAPAAFDYCSNWPEGYLPEPGARVLFKRYDGWLHKRDGETFRILEDKSIVAVVREPNGVDDLLHAVSEACSPIEIVEELKQQHPLAARQTGD